MLGPRLAQGELLFTISRQIPRKDPWPLINALKEALPRALRFRAAQADSTDDLPIRVGFEMLDPNDQHSRPPRFSGVGNLLGGPRNHTSKLAEETVAQRKLAKSQSVAPDKAEANEQKHAADSARDQRAETRRARRTVRPPPLQIRSAPSTQAEAVVVEESPVRAPDIAFLDQTLPDDEATMHEVIVGSPFGTTCKKSSHSPVFFSLHI
jgi:hypothetical protein